MRAKALTQGGGQYAGGTATWDRTGGKRQEDIGKMWREILGLDPEGLWTIPMGSH